MGGDIDMTLRREVSSRCQDLWLIKAMGIRKIIQGECVEYKRKGELRQNPGRQQTFRKLQKRNRKKKKSFLQRGKIPVCGALETKEVRGFKTEDMITCSKCWWELQFDREDKWKLNQQPKVLLVLHPKNDQRPNYNGLREVIFLKKKSQRIQTSFIISKDRCWCLIKYSQIRSYWKALFLFVWWS